MALKIRLAKSAGRSPAATLALRIVLGMVAACLLTAVIVTAYFY